MSTVKRGGRSGHGRYVCPLEVNVCHTRIPDMLCKSEPWPARFTGSSGRRWPKTEGAHTLLLHRFSNPAFPLRYSEHDEKSGDDLMEHSRVSLVRAIGT